MATHPVTELPTRRISFLDVVNTVGSLASITGISLLWLKGESGINWEVLLLLAFAVPAAVGLVSAVAWALILGYRRLASGQSTLVRVAYIGLSGPAAVLIVVLLALIANKLFISINWQWFFQQ